MLLKKLSLGAMALAALLVGGRSTLADTITLHDLSQNTTTGVFTYTVTLDGAADVTAGDGFVIYDFPGYVAGSATLTGAITLGQFSLTLINSTSSPLNAFAKVDLTAAVISGHPDNPAIPNLVFSYVGPPTEIKNNGSDSTTAILSLTSTVLGGTTGGAFGSIDNSGTVSNPMSASGNAVTVPGPGSSVPLPSASISGAAMIGLLGLGRLLKTRRLNA